MTKDRGPAELPEAKLEEAIGGQISKTTASIVGRPRHQGVTASPADANPPLEGQGQGFQRNNLG